MGPLCKKTKVGRVVGFNTPWDEVFRECSFGQSRSPVRHKYPTSEWTPEKRVYIYVTADRLLWKGECPEHAQCVGSLSEECPLESEQDVLNWVGA